MKEEKSKFQIQQRIKSFKYALNGLYYIVKNEHNFRIHVFASIVVIILSFLLKLSKTEWLFILSTIILVMVVEIINTAIEKTLNFIEPNYNGQVGLIKDISAFAVLLCSFLSIIIGLIIFLPKIILFFY